VRVYPGASDGAGVTVTAPDGRSARFTVVEGDVRAEGQADWSVETV
jgi:alpha-D-xyloside xylohydrolase